MSSLPTTYIEGFHDLEAVKSMEYKKLGKTDLMVSKLAFGSGPLGCHYGTYDEADAIEAMRRAIKQGINYIDTAPWYGQGRSEEILGKALKGIPRQAYYIATKVGRYELDYENMFNFTTEKIRKSFEKSLKLLGVNYVDVIQVHDIEFAPSLDIIFTQTLPELSRQVANGKARYIGITGYPVSVLKECVEKSNINISCVLTYTRLTLIDDTLLEYIPFFKERNIGVINAALPCMGALTNNGPPNWHPASDETKRQCTNAAQYCKDQDVELSKLAIWHSLQYTDTDTNLVGMQTMKQLEINMDVLRNGITEKEKALLQEIQKKSVCCAQ
ncbi:L-galactose dehydrogenase-like isoform X1 [Odontomachus brunneus]|uniref:L-galactose dehydrogenase-like isoform X1 n=1 Tax=Odontomachus brunneus TaxID=486640 RepID=UPI0013F1A435|nr:L-galactose dehydrogenase-like isoform X1 [Odontomachus brunneus]